MTDADEVVSTSSSVIGRSQAVPDGKADIDRQLRENVRSKENDLRMAEQEVKHSQAEISRVRLPCSVGSFHRFFMLLNHFPIASFQMREDQTDVQHQLESVREELVRVQDAARHLELQKLENGKLKETVDNLKLEVESLTQRLRLSSTSTDFGRSAGTPEASHIRSLGSELGSDLDSAEEEEGSETESEGNAASKPAADGSPAAPRRRVKTRRGSDGREHKTVEKHYILRTRNVVSPSKSLSRPEVTKAILLTCAAFRRAKVQAREDAEASADSAESEVYEEEDAIDVVEQGCQTAPLPERFDTGIQTEPLDDPPSYAESSGPKPADSFHHFSLSREVESINRRLLDSCYQLPITSNILRHVPSDWHAFFINTLTVTVMLSSPAFLCGWWCGLATTRWYFSNVLWLAVDTFDTNRDIGPTNHLAFLLRE